MQLRFQLQGRNSVTKGKQGRVKETEGVLNGVVYSHCHGFFSVQKILRKKPRFFVQQEEARDIRRELGMEIIEEHTVMEYSKVSKKCEKCGHGEATYYTRQMRSADKGQTTLCTCTGYGHPSQEN